MGQGEVDIFWKKHGHSVSFILRSIRVTFTLAAYVIGLSDAVFGNVPWKLIPTGISTGLTSSVGNIYVEMLLRCIVPTTAWRVLIGTIMLNCSINLLTSTYCLYSTMVIFQRRMLQQPCDSSLLNLFREVQLLNLRYNDLHKYLIVPGILLEGLFLPAVTEFILIAHWRKMDTVSIITVADSCFDGVVMILLCFHFAVKVYVANESSLKARKNVHFGKLWRRYWKSFKTLKIFFFVNNFFERLTPLIILQFAINLTINLVLLA